MKRERDALLLHNCNSENGVTTSVRAKTPEPAPPLNLPAPKPAAPTISQYFERPGASKQRIFKGLDAPRGSYPSQSSDTDEEAEVPVPSQTLRGSVSSKSLSSDATVTGASRGNPVTPTAKRKRSVFLEDSDEEFGGDDLNDSETERQLAAITDESARKQQRTRDVYDTPTARGASGVGAGGLPTPVSRRPGLLIGQDERERSAKRQRHAESPLPRAGDFDYDNDETQSQPGPGNILGDPETPTPYRKTDALAGPETTTTPTAAAAKAGAGNAAPAAEDYPKILDEVFSLLSQQPVSESTKRTLKAAIERHEMRVRGVVRGREAARAIIAERDARISKLQERVVALENGKKMDMAKLRELSSGLLKLSQEE